MEGNGGLPLEAEYDEALKVVTTSRVLTVDEYSDPGARLAAESDARAAVEALMSLQGLDYNDTPQTLWLRMEPMSGGPPRGHHFEFRARVRVAARG